MNSEPDASRLLEAVRKALVDDVAPELTGAARYQALLAANAVAIAGREIAVDDADLRELVNEISALTGEPAEDEGDAAGSLSRSEQVLVKAIRQGEFDDKDARRRLLAVLREAVMFELRLTNPKIAEKAAARHQGSSTAS